MSARALGCVIGAVVLLALAGCAGSSSGGSQGGFPSSPSSSSNGLSPQDFRDGIGSACQGLTTSLATAYGEFATNPSRENKILTLKTGVNSIEGVLRVVREQASGMTASQRAFFRSQAIQPLTDALAAAHRLLSGYRLGNTNGFQSARKDLAAAEQRYLQYGRSVHAFGCSANPVVPLTRQELCKRARQQGVTAPFCRS